MIKTRILAALAALLLAPGAALAAGGDRYIENYSFSFDGPFGRYDQDQLRRGFQVYQEVCSSCHGLRYVPIRTLADEGGPHFSEAEVRAIAESIFVADYDNNLNLYDPEIGDLRALTPNDNFPVNASQGAPDLSLMAKARARGGAGADYIASLMTHYTGSVSDDGLYGNDTYGGYLSMAPPLDDGWVEFQDGSPNDVEAMSMDVAAFLMWAAEPHMMARKQMGVIAVIMLSVLSVLLYLTNKQIWAPVKARAKAGTPAE